MLNRSYMTLGAVAMLIASGCGQVGTNAVNAVSQTGAVASATAHKLGYNVTALPPGKSAFPFHAHRINEEMFLVLEGTGEVRIGATRHPIRAGDVIACPPGGPETAHQIVNTSSGELKYLAVSTRLSPEIAEYPDTGRFGVLAEFPPGPDGKLQGLRFMGRAGESLN